MRSDLIYDVGMHVGKDTEFYLSKGFSVVAIEADPAFTAMCEDRLSRYIASDRLHIINAAITDRNSPRWSLCSDTWFLPAPTGLPFFFELPGMELSPSLSSRPKIDQTATYKR